MVTAAKRKIWGQAATLAVFLTLAVALVPTCALGQTLTYDYKGEGVSDLTTKLVVTKLDQNRLYVKGAVLAICRADTGEELVRWTTEEDDRIFDRYLNSGVPLNVNEHYVIKEIETPEGYESIEDVEFYIDSYGNAVVVNGADAVAENREQIVLTDVRLLVHETVYEEQVVHRSDEAETGDQEGQGFFSRLAQTGDPMSWMVLAAGVGIAVVALAGASGLAKMRMRG
ncbi:hypothetical protein [Adlercreutzia sp. ZJ242]|uniref:hypothetical protein n=1 Tax=Adlercreutzia sp. ZJ242 TaxID=2709409 RepID=UPI0013EB81C2|nr:hypothetical protein [Adlercreutzia sp. ZJ242]